MENETDRDLAEQLTDLISDCLTLIETINDNKYVPHIIQQPVDYTGEIGTNATFDILANNVKSYLWQSRKGTPTWTDTTSGSGQTAHFVTSITEVKNGREFRCQITGLDNSIIYSDIVKLYVAT